MNGPARRSGAVAMAAALCAVLWCVTLRAAPRGDLTGVKGLIKVYDAILDARFDDVEADLADACPPAPSEACDVLAATATWWRIMLDPQSRALDARFVAQTERAIASTDAWVEREPDSAEAHFYAGGAYAARVQWRVLRDEKVAAARDGKRIKQALEEAIELDPGLDDAYFGIGLYQYYADVAPAAAKMLRFLLMLPGGDKTEGLARMRRARAEGQLLRGEADYQLQIIYLWYEKRADLAIELLDSLRHEHPTNPLFVADLADVRDRYQHDITGSLATWRSLLAAARAGTVREPGLAEARARLGIARQLERLHQSDAALEQLRAVLAQKPARPAGTMAAAYLALGESEDRLGHRDAAVAAYRLAVTHSIADDPEDTRKRASDRIKKTPDAAAAEAYRLSLDGLRKFEKGDIASAESALARSLSIDPRQPVARYRYAHVLLSKKDDAGALAQLEVVIRSARDCPAPIAASAYYEAARIHERLAHRDKAIEYYRAASAWFGGAAETRASAGRALQRLRAPQ
jgi:predicted Zn-dependent protease